MNGRIRSLAAVALAAAAVLGAGCAPQLDRIEVGVQENRGIWYVSKLRSKICPFLKWISSLRA